MSSNPSLSLNPLVGTLSCSLMPHIHLTILISACWCATSFSFCYRPGLTSMQHTTLHTAAVQSPTHYQWYILIGKHGTNCLNLFHLVRIRCPIHGGGQQTSMFRGLQWKWSTSFAIWAAVYHIMATVKKKWKYVLEEQHPYSARWRRSGGTSISICRQSWDCTKH